MKPGARSPSNRRGKFLDGMSAPSKMRVTDAVMFTAIKMISGGGWKGEPRNRHERRTMKSKR